MGVEGAKAVGADLAAILARDPRPWYRRGYLLHLNFIVASLVLFSSSIGYDGSMMNGLLALPLWNEFMNFPKGAWLGLINAIYSLGYLPTLPISAWVANKYGRKLSVYIAYVLLIIGVVLQTAANNPATFVVARLVLGMACGFFSPAPILITEIAFPSHRGIVTALYNCGWYVGAIVAAWTTFGTRNYASSWCWRLPSVLQILVPLVALPGFILAPESPRWLVSVGRMDEARAVLEKYHGGGEKVNELVNYEMIEIQDTIRAEKEASATSSYADMVKTKGNRHRLLITVSLGIFGQWVGNGIAAYYLAPVLITVGITSVTHQTLIGGCLQIWNFAFAIGAACSVDKVGRKALFLASGVTMLISYIVITALSAVYAEGGSTATGVAVIPFIFIFYAGYDIALTPLLVAYPCEIWPFALRARGVSVVYFSTLTAVFFNIFVNPIALEAIQWKYYFVFLVMLVVMILTVWFYYPETRGRSLEQIGYLFDGEDAGAPSSAAVKERATSVTEIQRRESVIEIHNAPEKSG